MTAASSRAPTGAGDQRVLADRSTEGLSPGVAATVAIYDRKGEERFAFQTTRGIPIRVDVQNGKGPVSGAIVTVSDPLQNDRVLFQGITGRDGRISGRVTVATSTGKVGLSLVLGNHVAVQTIQTEGLLEIHRAIVLSGAVSPGKIPDSDGDGVPDDLDAYPWDGSRSSAVNQPGPGISVVSYEDPSSKTARGFNDLTVQVSNTLDLNAPGRVVRLRGEYQYLAQGAEGERTLFLNLPGKGGTVHYVIRDGAGNTRADFSRSLKSLKALPVIPREAAYFANPDPDSNLLYDSSSFCPGKCNVTENGTITPGFQVELEVVFDDPVDLSNFATFPFDLYVYRKSTRKEIHFPGFYFNPDGSDQYLDAGGRPWALRIPTEWNWPLEGVSVDQGYPRFRAWYESKGATDRDWYLQTTNESERHLFRYYSRSPIAAYFLQVGLTNRSMLWAFIAVILTGLIVLLFLRGRSEYEA